MKNAAAVVAVLGWILAAGSVAPALAASVPLAPVVTGPTGNVGSNPTYTWNASASAAWYLVYLNDSTGNRINQWYAASQVGCASGTGTCSFTGTVPLAVGSAQLWVLANNSSGNSGWSAVRNFTVGNVGTASAVIKQVWEVAATRIGGSARLWAQVQNTGSGALPADAKVWFYVSGPSWTGDHYVASGSVAHLAPGTEQWFSFDWTVVAGRPAGSYTYWARVTGTELSSPWSSGQNFTVTATTAQLTVTRGWETNGVMGGTATLWAEVRNDASTVPPAGSKVWFYVTNAAGVSAWVGSAPIDGLAPGTTQWFGIKWSIPFGGQGGNYTYRAQVYSPAGATSEVGPAQTFLVR